VSFQVEFIKFDGYRSAPRALSCLATRFATAEQARVEAELAAPQLCAAKGAEGFRIVEFGALVVAEKRLLASA